MKNIVILFITVFWAPSFVHAQTHFIDFIDQGHSNYRSGNYSQSIIYWDSLFQTSPSWFNNTFGVLISEAQERDSTAIAFIHQYSKSNLESSKVMAPMSLYFTVRDLDDGLNYNQLIAKLSAKEYKPQETNSSSANTLLDSLSKVRDDSYYSALYYTATFLELQQKVDFSQEQQIKWANTLQVINRNTNEQRFMEVKALKKYLDFVYKTAYYHLNVYPEDSLFAVNFSPKDIKDLSYFSIFEDSTLNFPSIWDTKKEIIENNITVDKSKYLEYGALNVSSFPSMEHLNWLKSLYANESGFESYWIKKSQSNWSSFPNEAIMASYIDSLSSSNQWVVLDIWGTWCGSCIRELPTLAEMDLQQKEMLDHPIKFLTLSYGSKDLDTFMDTNSYSFPVMEINKETIKNLKVTSYPTTYLISPNHQFMILPSFSNKVEMIKLFTMLDW